MVYGFRASGPVKHPCLPRDRGEARDDAVGKQARQDVLGVRLKVLAVKPTGFADARPVKAVLQGTLNPKP